MLEQNPLQILPTEFDLPGSDNQPVDNELQLLIPVLLRAILALLWADRNDWFLGVNLGLYYEPKLPAIVPDGFLSLGVPRVRANGKLRLSYLLWQENVMPQWVLEVVSQTYGSKYDEKLREYANLGVLYYTVYNPNHWQRDKHDPFEVYRLVGGRYVRQPGNPSWMPEAGLGIGVERGTHEGVTQDWLYWYDERGNRYPAPEDAIAFERNRAEQAEQQLEAERRSRQNLLEKLRQMGIDPDQL
ncbi:Uma2 family endonuclease [Leptolyngbya boryana CZ1]|uniref:Uma2 family endonuclease n=1 Tax=Leptolyngbya boryana CZ1 TaxID=3060204 RepID=A0AA96WQK9_LEPBY|nr:Uma2 family endonuclease [Leptolyngbya boryana]WNZ44091.1 Uma2 family endonuclease [Leptolyngbya boryana CZ1]